MRLLLDTHAALWWSADDPRLGGEADRLIGESRNEILLSAVVVWEVAIKRGLGKLDAPADFGNLVLGRGAVGLPVTLAHAAAVADLPDHHRDPFDRLLVAQAVAADATLISRDPAFARYDVAVAW